MKLQLKINRKEMMTNIKLTERRVRLAEAHGRACKNYCQAFLRDGFSESDVWNCYRHICSDYNKNLRIAKDFASQKVVIVCNFWNEYDQILANLREMAAPVYSAEDAMAWMYSDDATLLLVSDAIPESLAGCAGDANGVVFASLPLKIETFSNVCETIFPHDSEQQELTYYVQRIGLSSAIAGAILRGETFSEMVESETFYKTVGVKHGEKEG